MNYINPNILPTEKITAQYDKFANSKYGVRWGILGAGGIASLFTRQLLASGGRVEAVASRSLEKAQNFQRLYGGGRYGTQYGTPAGVPSSQGGAVINKAYGSYEELVKDPNVDVIYIATPHSEHYVNAKLALNAGKPVLVEKAFTQNLSQAEEIFNLAEQKNLFVMEAMWTKFLPHILEVKRITESGKLGNITALFADFGILKAYDPEHRLYNPNLAGGALLDLGIYPVSFAHHILGVPTSFKTIGQLAPTGVDVNLGMLFDYKESAQAILHTTSIAESPTTASIVGTKGRIDIYTPFYRPSNFAVHFNDGTHYEYNGPREYQSEIGKDGAWGMQFEAAEVARCLAAGMTQSDVHTWKHTLEIMELLDQIRADIGVKFPNEG